MTPGIPEPSNLSAETTGPHETLKPITLSLCMIVKNEEANIERALLSIKPVVDEMIVVDTGSTDNTKDIAKSIGAKVYDFNWTDNFSEARNFSLSKASGKWIFILDADEIVASSDIYKLKNVIQKTDSGPVAYAFITRNYVLQANTSGWIANDRKYLSEETGTGWYPGEKVRLFPNISSLLFEYFVHERIEPSLVRLGIKIERCDIPIHHYGKLIAKEADSKAEQYYLMGKRKLAESGNQDAIAMYELAIQAAELRRYEETVEYLMKVIALKPDFAKAYQSMGNAYFNMSGYDDALSFYKKALELDPDLRDSALMYSTCLVYTGNAEGSIPILQGLLSNNSPYPQALLLLAESYFCVGEKDKAHEYVKNLEEMDFDCTAYFIKFAKILMSAQRIGYAISLLGSAFEPRTMPAEAYRLLNECYRIQSKTEESGEIQETKHIDTISLCMIVKNEERNIERSLKSIKDVVDEMIIIDTGSTDKTKEIARALGAKAYDFHWTNSFAEARNFSLSKSSCRWILILDADEVIAPSDHENLKILVQQSARYNAYSFITRNYIREVKVGWIVNDGKYKEEAGTGWIPSDKVRLFPNNINIRFINNVHELVEPSFERLGIEIKHCKIPIHHYGKLDEEKEILKNEIYYDLGKKQVFSHGGTDIKAICELAIQAETLGKHEEALEYFQKIIAIEPDFQKAHYGLGTTYFSLGRFEDALLSFRKAMELDPDSVDTIILLTTCEVCAGNAEVAIMHLEKLFQQGYAHPLAIFTLAAAYACTARKEKIPECIKKLRDIHFDSWHFFNNFAKILISNKRSVFAISLLETAAELGIMNQETRELLADCYKMRGGNAHENDAGQRIK